jgi:hypothetical protein
MDRLLEKDIKALLLNFLKEKGFINSHSIIMSELTIGDYSRRVDLAILTNGKLIAFEIKSEADSLYRLDGQLQTYSKYFDKVIIIFDKKFSNHITNNVSKDYGKWEITSSTFKVVNRGRSSKKIDSSYLIDYLDIADLGKLAKKYDIKDHYNKNNIVQLLPNSKIRAEAFSVLTRKFCYSSSLFLSQTLDKKITTKNISLLSRFAEERARIKSEKEQRAHIWNNFQTYLDEFKNSITN